VVNRVRAKEASLIVCVCVCVCVCVSGVWFRLRLLPGVCICIDFESAGVGIKEVRNGDYHRILPSHEI
jgi:hypothetical protein